jgi:two-component system chemotaxis sensor kinase CheA
MELSEEMQIFLVEAFENLDKVESLLVDIERAKGSADSVNPIFRSVHTIKGNAGFLGLQNLETLCHRAEAVLDKARSGKLVITSDVVTILLSAVDSMREICQKIESDGTESGIDTSSPVALLSAMLTTAS